MRSDNNPVATATRAIKGTSAPCELPFGAVLTNMDAIVSSSEVTISYQCISLSLVQSLIDACIRILCAIDITSIDLPAKPAFSKWKTRVNSHLIHPMGGVSASLECATANKAATTAARYMVAIFESDLCAKQNSANLVESQGRGGSSIMRARSTERSIFLQILHDTWYLYGRVPDKSKHQQDTRFDMVCVLLVISAFALANIGEGLAPACHGTQEPGHRQCYTLHANVNTSNDCRQLCCASSAASPVPYPGIVSPGCVAWSAAIRTDSQGQTHGQCGMCVGTHDGRPIPVPPVNTSACPTGDVCTTGMVDARLWPLYHQHHRP